MVYSFNDVVVTATGLEKRAIAWGNYSRMLFKDTEYRQILLNALKGIFIDSIIIILFSFFFANVLNQKFFGRTFARTVFFLPVILATGLLDSLATNDLVMSLYGSNTGTEIASGLSGAAPTIFNIEQLLSGTLSPGMVTVITDAVTNISQIVNDSGVQILIFLAGLQAISPSVFEAARVEGATKWEEFWKITFPMMTPMIAVNVIYTIIDTFTRPAYGVLTHIQNVGLNYMELGYAAALSWAFCLMVAVILIFAAVILRLMMKYSA